MTSIPSLRPHCASRPGNPLLNADQSASAESGPFSDLLALARQLTGRIGLQGNWAHAALAWRIDPQADLTGSLFAVQELTHPPHALMLAELVSTVVGTGQPRTEPLITNDTAARPDFANVCPIRFFALFPIETAGEIAGYLILYDAEPGVLQPATQRSLELLARQAGALHELRSARQELLSARETIARIGTIKPASDDEGVWVMDADGATQFVNDHLLAMLGYARQELEGRTFTDFVERGTSRGMCDTETEQRLNLRHADGSIVSTDVLWQAIPGIEGESLGRIALIRTHTG